jgi:hypothetical protein
VGLFDWIVDILGRGKPNAGGKPPSVSKPRSTVSQRPLVRPTAATPEVVESPAPAASREQSITPKEKVASKPAEKNFYVYIDTGLQRKLEGAAKALSERHLGLKNAAVDGDYLTPLFDLVFPHGMPADFHVANLSWDSRPDYPRLAVRPVITPGRPWPFSKGVSIAAIGTWRISNQNPIFLVENFLEVADTSARPYEQLLSVYVYKEKPSESSVQTRNVLTEALARELPAIAVKTAANLQDWSDFLAWKRRLVSEQTKGLRYVRVEWQDDNLVFRVLAETEESLREGYGAIQREDATAFVPDVSSDLWTFRIDEHDSGRRTPRSYQLGRPRVLKQIPQDSKQTSGCPWPAPVAADISVSLSDDDLNKLMSLEEPAAFRHELSRIIPAEGFLSVSAAGDLSLIKRHESAIERLRDQGGYAPYLSSYLFDVKQARVPSSLEPVTDWFRDDLNHFQKEAVQKIIAAPDLCLVQGPPGTGKTTVIAEAIMQLTRLGQSVLLVSQAHTAVDNALCRLGRHADLRPIRLARFPDKISEEGQPFAQAGSLSRYYQTLAEQTESRFFRPWRDAMARRDTLQTCYEKAEYAHHDLVAATEALGRHERERVQLTEARDHAWQELQTGAQRQLDADLRRQRLVALQEFLRDVALAVPTDLSLPEPHASALADAIFGLDAVKARLPVTRADWDAVPQQRPQSLTGLLRFWRKVQGRQGDLVRDLERLVAAGSGPIQDPESAVRLAQCEEELRSLERRLENQDNADDSDLLKAWKERRQELKRLRSGTGGSLNPDLYGDIFTDADQLCAPISDPQELSGTLRSRLAALEQLEPVIESTIGQLRLGTIAEIQASNARPVDEGELQTRQAALELHEHGFVQLESTRDGCWSRLKELLAEGEKFSRIPGAPFDKDAGVAARLDECRWSLEAAQRSVAEHDAVRAVWGLLLQDWVEDLSQPDAAGTDWAHFKNVFLPLCNVVAITCNENEQTLEKAGLVYFDVAIIDEVSKATPLELLLPLMRARRAVLVGDHRQLPPLFQEGLDAQTFSDAVDEAADDEEVRRTALTPENLLRFEKMVTASLFKSHFEGADNSIRARLEIQFRMHPQIMSLVNHFYEHRLTCGLENPDAQRAHRLTLVDKLDRPIITSEDHVLWIDTSLDLNDRVYREDVDGAGRPMRGNQLEAQLIGRALVQMDEQCALVGYSKSHRKQVGVVSFYAQQCRVIREAIKKLRPGGRFDCLDVDVNTVIRYQGKEKQIILVSLVRNDGVDLRGNSAHVRQRSSRANVARFEFINVAFSRAQELLIVFGARSMIESYEVNLPNMDGEGQSSRPVYKDILNSLDRQARVIPASRFITGTMGGPKRAFRSGPRRRGEP